MSAPLQSLANVFPLLATLRGYRRADLMRDAVAGITVAVMLIPQAMGYALLAGLPPEVGLYASTFPMFAYALIGSSRPLSVAPVAMISLLLHATVAPLAKGDTKLYLSLAAETALIAGLLKLALGTLRLGVLVNFLSHAVASGFTSAAAVVILLSQGRHILGIDARGGETAISQVLALLRGVHQANGRTVLVAVGAIVLIVALRRWAPRAPAPMLAAILGSVMVWALGWGDKHVAVVGALPRGVPDVQLFMPHWDLLPRILPAAATISVVGFVESVAVANVLAARDGYRISPSRELVALGAADIASAAVGGYPVTGGLSRTAVNYQAGARTQVASVWTAAIVLISLHWLTPAFEFTPKAVLASIVVVSVAGLIDLREFWRLYRVVPSDGWTFALTFLVTLTAGVEAGLFAGVLFSIGLFVWRSSRPRIVEEGFVAADRSFRDVKRFPDAQTSPDVCIFRVDGPLYFANMRFVEDRLRDKLAERPVKLVVFDMTSVTDMDAVAAETLHHWVRLYEEQSIRFAFAGMKGPVVDVVRKAGWPEEYCRQTALAAALEELGLHFESESTHTATQSPHNAPEPATDTA